MNKEQAEIASNWLGEIGNHINRACSYMSRLRKLRWIDQDEKWELKTRSLEDKLWILEKEMDNLLLELYEIADL